MFTRTLVYYAAVRVENGFYYDFYSGPLEAWNASKSPRFLLGQVLSFGARTLTGLGGLEPGLYPSSEVVSALNGEVDMMKFNYRV